MSDKLIIEFYDPKPLNTLCACIFVAHGGYNPASAAVTLLDFFDVAVIPPQRTYGYQLMRLYTQDGRPHVHSVPDHWTTEQELRDAAILLLQPNVSPPAHITMFG